MVKRPNTERSSRRKRDKSLEKASIIEKAYDKTSSIVKSIAWYMKDKFEKLKDYVW